MDPAAAGAGTAVGPFFAPAFVAAGLAGMGAIFLYLQENHHRVQEKIQRETGGSLRPDVKHLYDMDPEVI